MSYSLNPKHIISLYRCFFRTLILLMVCAITLGCQPDWEENKLSQIVKQNALHVGIINGPQTYYIGNAGAAGFDYELASDFADYLGVTAIITVFYDHDALQAALEQDDIDIAITGDALGDDLPHIDQYGPVLHYVNQVLVTSSETPNVNAETTITVVANSSNHKLLTRELETLSGKIEASYDMDKHEILRRLATGEVAATVVDSNALSIMRTRYPQLAIHQILALHQKVAWGLHTNSDDSLLAALYEFISQSRGS
ncbi:transporter substrate-binding domain-containing protein, partial [Alteromonas sp. 14N.309.X.WAT.G.H12]|uniref:transporter substrate-binding domain-containing protein n=1 Tax=Alteromonas sp. 14N.309.X.WAT.G.H12 TaxID=3120824 RepID=UPI002FD43AC8